MLPASMTSGDDSYDLTRVRVPVLRGNALRLMAAALRSPLRGLLSAELARQFGISGFRRLRLTEAPVLLPHYPASAVAPAGARMAAWPEKATAAGPGFRFPTVHDYAAAYRERKTTPEEVALRFLEAVGENGEALPRAFAAVQRDDVLRQARESERRIAEGRALSVLDGVPVAVKDELDMRPYGTTAGTRFMGRTPASADATVIARLRQAGALLLGKTAMHEIGMGVTGLNVLQGTPRNPWAPAHYCGGSSSGSAAAVAAGLCPLATGADGGGSIRIPAAFCGVVGLKPTFGRVSEQGAVPLCWSLGHIGPIAATVADAALGYAVMAGPDRLDVNSLHQPAPALHDWNFTDLKGLRLGVYPPWFRHAEPEIVAACEAMLRHFGGAGAVVREITLPELESARLAHAVTIAAEMAHCVDHIHRGRRQRFNLDVQVTLAVARTFTASDYIRAQQVRARTMEHFRRAFEDVDLIVTPATGVVAPVIDKAAAAIGESDLTSATEIMRFAAPANLTGHPAISFPAGYTKAGLPVGMQAIGRPWEESGLLRLALAAQQQVERRRPEVWHAILDDAEGDAAEARNFPSA